MDLIIELLVYLIIAVFGYFIINIVKELTLGKLEKKRYKKEREKEMVMDLQSLVRWDIEVTQKQNRLLRKQLGDDNEEVTIDRR